jgi:alpha-glucosidase
MTRTGFATEPMTSPEPRIDTAGAQWWRGAVIYQIYPRSFRDTTGDGIGDLAGIIDGLAHVARLGVDAVWISPFFVSPMRDYGYDVADYCDVDPIFGTLADFDRLVARAHGLGLKVIIDQVYSHTSDAHPWFEESRRDRDNARADWYVWADARPDGSPPSNWQSVFGGPAWTWDARRKQYYLHNFLACQPDLNVHNRAVQDALLDVARFWLDRGVDGFRLDAINFATHDRQLRDNPSANAPLHAVTRPLDMQRPIHNQSQPETVAFLERLRALTDAYPGRFTVAEIGGPEPLEEMRRFTEGEGRLNSAYSFDFLYADRLTPQIVRRALDQWRGAPGEGWPSWTFSNHDAPRALSRWSGPEHRAALARLLPLLLCSLRGNAILYQGEELGLCQAHVPFEHLKDPEAIANWPLTLGRDGARTPFPWMGDGDNGGFSSGMPWLPVDPAHLREALDRQDGREDSVLAFTCRAIAARQASAALRQGDTVFLDTPPMVLAFQRQARDEQVLCVFNLGDAPVAWSPQFAAEWHLHLSSDPRADATTQLPETLAPRSGYWAVPGA